MKNVSVKLTPVEAARLRTILEGFAQLVGDEEEYEHLAEVARAIADRIPAARKK